MYEYNDLEYLKKELKTDLTKGLENTDASKRLLNNGKNILNGKKKDGFIKIFINQFKDPMIYILLMAIIVSAFLKEIGDSLVIAFVVVVNALIGAFQEVKTEKALEMLKKMSSHKCVVIRGGSRVILDAEDLVKGDLVCLESGNSVCADLRIVESYNLKIDESSITGESKPVIKYADSISESIKTLGDKKNMAYMSTFVVGGHGKGVVVSTGMNTEIGKIANVLNEDSGLTPLQKRLFDLGKLLGVLTVIVCGFLFVLAVIDQRNILDMLVSSISLAVAAIPEGLPAVVTIVLATGVQRMIKVNALVKRLPSVETLGAVSVVCSDKTGTLTENDLRCDGIFENGVYSNRVETDNEMLKMNFKFCNNAQLNFDNQYIGSPIEIALLKVLKQNEFQSKKRVRIEEKEFDSTRKMMSTLYEFDNRNYQFTKGAFDRIVDKCTFQVKGGKIVPFTKNDKMEAFKEMDKQANDAKRILAFSYKENTQKIDESEMVFIGFATFIDPPRKGVKEAVEKFTRAGVKTVMITGDYVKTGLAIAKQIGIAKSENDCISGEEIDALKESEMAEILEKKSVFARVSPQHKVKIIKAFQSNNRIVAMTGDGVNDAPSLKSADIGISMGINGSDVAKEASDMILIDDNFATIETAIEEGRNIYNNIKKSVLFLLSSNFSEIVVMMVAIVLGLPLPLLAIHVLLVNLLTDSIPALALGADLKEEDIMSYPPRDSHESLFANGGLSNTILYGVVMAGLTLFAFSLPSIQECIYYGVPFNINNMKQVLLQNDKLLISQTFAFVTLSLSEVFYAYVARNFNRSVLSKNILANKYLNLATMACIVITGGLVMVEGANEIFKFSRITPITFAVLGLIAVSVALFKELISTMFHVKRLISGRKTQKPQK